MSSALRFVDADVLCATSFVRHVEIYDELPSTNDRAMQLTLFEALEMPALIIARRQLAGRGRGRHHWWSADGALTFSLVVEPAACGLVPNDWPRLSLTTAVAVRDAIQNEIVDLETERREPSPTPRPPHPVPCSIKWPNDVLVDGRKVCGILLESPGGAAPAKNRLVIGVGINVNNSWRSAPPEAGSSGSALCDITGRQHDNQAVLVAFLKAFDQRLTQLANNDSELSRAWQQHSWLTKQNVEVEIDGRIARGICLGIALDGALLIQTPSATERIYGGSASVLE